MTATNDQQPTLAGYVINAANCTIKPVRVRQDSEGLTLQHLYELIGCDTVEALTMAAPHSGTAPANSDDGPPCITLWFNEEPRAQHLPTFLVEAPYPCTMTPIRGLAVLLGTDEEGGCVDCPWPIEKVRAQFWWMGGPVLVRADHLAADGQYDEPQPDPADSADLAATASIRLQGELSALRAAAGNLLRSMEAPRSRTATDAWDALRTTLELKA